MKAEDTFIMVRDGGEADPLNDVSMNARILPEGDALLEGSMFRNMPDEAAGFEHDLLRGDAEMD